MSKLLKKNYKLISLVMLLVMLGGVIVYGVDTYENKVITIEEDKKISGDFIGTANQIINKGVISGDLITAAEDIYNNGVIGGDLLGISGKSIHVDGNVNGNLRLIGQDIAIMGEVHRNASIFATKIFLEENGVLDGSLYIFTGDLNVKGFVGGDIRGGAGTAVISGTVKGNVNLNVNKLFIEPGAVIEGDLIYTSDEEQVIDPTSVKGNIQFIPAEESGIQIGLRGLRGAFRILFNAIRVIYLISYILIGLLLIKLFKIPFKKTGEIIEEKPWYSLGLGVSTFIGVPLAVFILIITLVGIPVSMLMTTLYILLLFFAKMPIALWLGGKILRDEKKYYTSFIIGSLLIAALKLVPVLGVFLNIGLTALGIGIILITIKRYYKNEYDGGDSFPPVH